MHPFPPARSSRSLLYIAALWILGILACFPLHGQSPAPGGRIYGTVSDPTGNVIQGAHVTLQRTGSTHPRILSTDSAGEYNFTELAAGTYRLSVASEGFSLVTEPAINLQPGQYYAVPPIALQVAAAKTSMRVVFSSQALAEEQVRVQEKQRVLGVVPNFYTSYVWDAEPLSTRQKYALGLKTSIDPATIILTGAIAGIQQWQNSFRAYGQGAQGYAKRYGASYTGAFTGIMLGGAVLPSLFHQDPRYFYKGTGSIRSRTLYAISTVAICKGDNGRWQPNYSNVLGTFGAAGISNLYYPSNDRGFQLTMENSLLGLAGGAASSLLQEFLIRKISRGVPPSSSTQH